MHVLLDEAAPYNPIDPETRGAASGQAANKAERRQRTRNVPLVLPYPWIQNGIRDEDHADGRYPPVRQAKGEQNGQVRDIRVDPCGFGGV